MTACLIEELKKVRDFRTKQGQRHPLWLVLLLVIMGTMSGCCGYRSLGDFVGRHKQSLIDILDIPKDRVPSYSTMRRVMMRVNFEELTRIFNCWANQYIELSEREWLATDGKSIKSTVLNYSNAYQEFVSLVSIFSSKQGVVVGLQPMNNKESSEIATVQSLIAALDIKGAVFSFDALHCQKKTVEQIIDSGNDYVIAVKANQPKLYNQIQQNMRSSQPTSIYTDSEKIRDRITSRQVSVFDNLENISSDWIGLKRIVRVERVGTRGNNPYSETAYYISSITLEAADFAQGIRGHWGIENQLHWVKDVVFEEDKAQMVDGYAAANFSILRSFVINLFRHHGFDSLTRAIRQCAHNIQLLFSFLE